jgi:cytochrome c553
MGAKSATFALVLVMAAPAAAQPGAPAGAASCSGCHAPAGAGGPVPPLDGRAASDTVTAMQEFRAGQRAATVMDRIAKGFSDAEIQAIAAWYAAQK